VNVTPDGSVPDSASDGVGVPTEVTVNVEEVNVGKLALAAEVMTGAVFTVNVKACVAFGVWPLAAVNVRWYVPFDPGFGVPDRCPRPFPPSVYVTPEGSAPDSPIEGVGSPLVCTVKLNGTETCSVTLFALVMLGATGLNVNVEEKPDVPSPVLKSFW
jgi:hypothetical protein